ncbi:MAG: TrmH family RNA methyltransferase [Spirochaetales bacterium]
MADPTVESQIELLSRLVTRRRLARLREVAAGRTRYLSLVLEDVRNPFNATAVTRTCEGIGVHELHVVENEHRFQLNPGVTQGASKWLDMKRWRTRENDNTADCLSSLTARGYRLFATSPHTSGYTPDTLPLDKPAAIVFGHEKTGVSERAFEMCDAQVRIPMYGFVESFNLTVSVGICLSRLRSRVEEEVPEHARVSKEEQDKLLLAWLRQSLPRRVLAAMSNPG